MPQATATSAVKDVAIDGGSDPSRITDNSQAHSDTPADADDSGVRKVEEAVKAHVADDTVANDAVADDAVADGAIADDAVAAVAVSLPSEGAAGNASESGEKRDLQQERNGDGVGEGRNEREDMVISDEDTEDEEPPPTAADPSPMNESDCDGDRVDNDGGCKQDGGEGAGDSFPGIGGEPDAEPRTAQEVPSRQEEEKAEDGQTAMEESESESGEAIVIERVEGQVAKADQDRGKGGRGGQGRKEELLEKCLWCAKVFPLRELSAHVNACLDSFPNSPALASRDDDDIDGGQTAAAAAAFAAAQAKVENVAPEGANTASSDRGGGSSGDGVSTNNIDGGGGSSKNAGTGHDDDGKETCPLCSEQFPRSEIILHADVCADKQMNRLQAEKKRAERAKRWERGGGGVSAVRVVKSVDYDISMCIDLSWSQLLRP